MHQPTTVELLLSDPAALVRQRDEELQLAKQLSMAALNAYSSSASAIVVEAKLPFVFDRNAEIKEKCVYGTPSKVSSFKAVCSKSCKLS